MDRLLLRVYEELGFIRKTEIVNHDKLKIMLIEQRLHEVDSISRVRNAFRELAWPDEVAAVVCHNLCVSTEIFFLALHILLKCFPIIVF